MNPIIILTSEVFQQDIPTVTITHIPNDNHPVCVLGVLETKLGLRIKDEMTSWLIQNYDLYIIAQASPGALFEYPALFFAQQLSGRLNCPVLYLHTKGAANNSEIQKRIRQLWKNEFTGERSRLYIDSKADVTCPFLGPNNETWYNGMYISPKAFASVSISPSDNRYDFQRLFAQKTNLKFRGIIKEGMDAVSLNTYMSFYGRPKDFSQEIVWKPLKKR